MGKVIKFIAEVVTSKYFILLACSFVIAIFMSLGIAAVSRYARHNYIVIPLHEVPGFTFLRDGITYQVRPIKATMTIYMDGKADSTYRSMLRIEDIVSE